jgi:hypothetical protein
MSFPTGLSPCDHSDKAFLEAATADALATKDDLISGDIVLAVIKALACWPRTICDADSECARYLRKSV